MKVLLKIKKTFNDLKKCAVSVSEKHKKSSFFIFFDMLISLVLYSASPNNYEKFDFCNLSAKQRKTYFTYGHNRKMIRTFNNSKDVELFENKLKFAEEFSDMFKRDYLSVSDMTYDEFQKFCVNKEKLICKPYGGSQGANIKVFRVTNIQEIFNELKTDFSDGYMLEEWIKQHEVLDRIYPDAVNCLRVITIFDGNEIHLITGGVTFSIETEIANGSQPSIVAPVDMQTGLLSAAATFGSELFDCHPRTHERIEGVVVPYWNEVYELLSVACRRVPTIGYVGWDIAITPTGPVLIEGNTTPGYKYYQIPIHLKNGIGNKEKYVKFLKR